MKDLSDTLRVLIDKEREAFGIGEGGAPAANSAESFVAFLHRMHQTDIGRLPFSAPRFLQ
jgi:hypothetical protein